MVTVITAAAAEQPILVAMYFNEVLSTGACYADISYFWNVI